MTAVSSTFSAINLICGCKGQHAFHQRSSPGSSSKISVTNQSGRRSKDAVIHAHRIARQFRVFAKTEGSADSSKSEEKIPSWAKPDSDEPPPWARGEAKQSSASESVEVPFYVYLLASAVTAIAAIGSIFEYANQNPVFGLLNSDSAFYAPVLGFFAITGVPTSAFLWYKSVQVANKEAEEQDRRDGYE